MTFRLVIGCDPGLSGALALLADGKVAGFIDMPVTARETKGNEVNARALADELKRHLALHDGAYVIAIVEKVNAMPSISKDGGPRRGMGSQSAFNFGDGFGVLRGVLATLGIGYVLVPSQMWKRHLRLTGLDKDAARQLVISQFPEAAEKMKRKKDVGRADALLLAHFGEVTEQYPKAA